MVDTKAIGAISNASLIGSAISVANLKKQKENEYAITLAGVDPDDMSRVLLDEKAFQWWPETLLDSISVGWNEKQIPGGSHSIMQWGSNGGRTISFEVSLTRAMKYSDFFDKATGDASKATLGFLVDPLSPKERPSNVDILSAVAYLRAFCYPQYSNGAFSKPPVICILSAKGMQLNEDGSDTIFTVMTGCEITYTRLFEDGKPRIAKASLTFKQVVQHSNGVTYKSLDDFTGRSGNSGIGTIGGYVTSRTLNNSTKRLVP